MNAVAPRHAPRPASRRLRAVLSWLHLWVGLSVGAVFALVALTGTVLVFHTDLLRLQHPQLAQHSAVADGRVLAALIERWQPEGLRSLDLPQDDLPVWQGFFEDGHRAYFAPENGALLLYRSEDDDVLMWLHAWHTKLLGGETGEEVLGVVGSIALALVLTGLYLWWPRRGQWLAHLKMHSGPPVRRWLSWHRSSGAMLFPLLLLATLTGVGMVYSKGFQTVLVGVFGGQSIKPPKLKGDGPVDWPRVIGEARAALPGARLSRVSVPRHGDAVVSFRARADGEWHPVGRSTIAVAADGTRVLQVQDATANQLGMRMSQAIFPVHVGAVGGPVLKWAMAATGVLPMFLLVTGFLFWRRRRGHR
ncbi:PepSY-associated TM helix domain-containing protein [Lysobacter sp. TAF61]|uniref:PepSY-associated TM helix domain-containing protein n=1 Tax=Lysobacter sp. TAF61 TaxID=3233072 RepID=UPI003F9B7404